MNIETLTDDELQAELKNKGITLHHKTGTQKLRETLISAISDVSEKIIDNFPSWNNTVKRLTEKEHEKKLTKEERAMRLVRIIVTPNDPLMNTYPGLIFTVGCSSIKKGRMIKKYVPFNNENGWHVSQIICDQIEQATMQKFKNVKMPNGEKKLQAYIAKKFNVQILNPLTVKERHALANAQASRGDS